MATYCNNAVAVSLHYEDRLKILATLILNFWRGRRQQRTDTGHVTIMEDRVLVYHKIMITLLSNQGQSLEHDVKAPLFGPLLF